MAERLRITWASLSLPESGAILGTGALVAQAAAINGTGVSASVGTGALVAQSARVTGRSGPRVEIGDILFNARTPSATTATREPGATVKPRRDVHIEITVS